MKGFSRPVSLQTPIHPFFARIPDSQHRSFQSNNSSNRLRKASPCATWMCCLLDQAAAGFSSKRSRHLKTVHRLQDQIQPGLFQKCCRSFQNPALFLHPFHDPQPLLFLILQPTDKADLQKNSTSRGGYHVPMQYNWEIWDFIPREHRV